MKKLISFLVLILLPQLVLAAETNSLSFKPPPSDLSVIYLGNLFGIVDGVLHGSGSQIMGAMFGVFNSAVLALGGIIIMYTLMVSTMNTAHEGQMLGQKWSSIWVPMRSTAGLALLIPKASGYCMMQIFVMWVVVQGVGAADKVWNAALSYLNRGGVIIQAQMPPETSLTSDAMNVKHGATVILAGQTCMLGLQTALSEKRRQYLEAKAKNTGPCSGSPNAQMKQFCESPVPAFLSTVNFVNAETNAKGTAPPYQMDMPNFTGSSPYAALNGICGYVQWNPFQQAKTAMSVTELTSDEEDAVKLARAIAIQQMYVDLTNVATAMVNNDPMLNTYRGFGNDSFSKIAIQQYGVPQNNMGKFCSSSGGCTNWGSDSLAPNNAPLFNGTEFQGAIADYNGIMLPSLNLASQAADKEKAQQSREFIKAAEAKGWMLAGSYFWNLAVINTTSANANLTDSNTGLDGSFFDSSELKGKIFPTAGKCGGGSHAVLCEWLQKDPTLVNHVVGLIDGSSVNAKVNQPKGQAIPKAVAGLGSSTTYGYISNALNVKIPGQPGTQKASYTMNFNFQMDTSGFRLDRMSMGCSGFMCIPSRVGEVLYNDIIRNIMNLWLDYVTPLVNQLIVTIISAPLAGLSSIFRLSVDIIANTNANPVIALAQMGAFYINFAQNLWITMIGLSMTIGIIPILGKIIMAIISLVMPLFLSWLSIMVTIGFITAYYIPFLPYMIFTFGAIAWLILVIEAMVAAPIVALGVTHPEGHEAFGKAEQAIMILINVFLRPAMMIIGYIAAIALSYIGVYILNEGFQNAMTIIQGEPSDKDYTINQGQSVGQVDEDIAADITTEDIKAGGMYQGWAGVYSYFFSLLIYTTTYLILVQKAFTLITYLPDKVLRWIGGTPESLGQETSQWTGEAQKQVEQGGSATQKGQAQMNKQMGAHMTKAGQKARSLANKPTEMMASAGAMVGDMASSAGSMVGAVASAPGEIVSGIASKGP